MKITDERKNKTVKFAELDFGDVFEYEDKKYMKTHEMNGGIDVNAFNISNGDIEYFDKLRCNTPWTAEQFADFEMCKERLTVYACKTLEQINVLDKIRAEVADAHLIGYATINGKREIASKAVLDIIDKYRKVEE